MKQIKILLGLSVMLFALILSSCSSDDDNDNGNGGEILGEIPGLGDNTDELTGTAFVLPNGIVLEQEIIGFDGSLRSTPVNIEKRSVPDYEESLLSLKAASASVDAIIGSGYYVRLFVPLKNTTSKDITVEFPAALIIKSVSGDYQHGVLLKKTKAVIPANEIYNIVLYMYCGNASKSSSSPYENYKWGVVSNSPSILDLCNRLRDKKINYEEFSLGEEIEFLEQVSYIQSLLWMLTDDGIALRQEDKTWISNLPNSSK